MELAEDVAEEVLDFVPGVDTVRAIQYNHYVHICSAPCQVWGFKNILLAKPGLSSIFLCPIRVCKFVVTLCCWSDGLSWFQVITDRGTDASAEHGCTTLLRPQRGTCLPSTHIAHINIRLTIETIKGASIVISSSICIPLWH